MTTLFMSGILEDFEANAGGKQLTSNDMPCNKQEGNSLWLRNKVSQNAAFVPLFTTGYGDTEEEIKYNFGTATYYIQMKFHKIKAKLSLKISQGPYRQMSELIIINFILLNILFFS